VHPFNGFDRVLGESGVRGADSCGWSRHDCVEQTAQRGAERVFRIMANWAAWRAAPRPISSPCTPPLNVDQSCEIKPRYRSIGSAAFVAV
jgi:hypothetical protein